MTALGYIRISIADQSVYSLSGQEQRIRDYCQINKINLLAVYKDQGESSYTFDRPDFKALEDFIKKKSGITYLIVADYDRFSRNLAEALLKIRELQTKYKISVLSVNDPIGADISDPSSFMITAFKLLLAENELHGIRKRTKSGIKQATLQGRFANKAPYGYINSKDEEGKAVILLSEHASNVREIFRLFLLGVNPKEISRQLDIKGKSNSIIHRVLTNRVYIGEVRVSGTTQWVKGIHAPLVSGQDFWTVQEKLNVKNHVSQPNDEVPLRGALRCFCGKKLTAGKSKGNGGNYWYYFCSEHKNYLPAKKLHKQFDLILESSSLPKEVIEEVKEQIIEKINNELASEDTNALKAELKRVIVKIESTEKKFLSTPEMSEKVYRSVIGELRQKERELHQRINAGTTNAKLYFETLNKLLPKLYDLKSSFDLLSAPRKRLFIDAWFNNSLSYENGIYRTIDKGGIFSSQMHIAKEKGLIKIDQPLKKIGKNPVSSENGSSFEQLMELYTAIA